MKNSLANITAVILAGGQGSRFGGVDKGMIKLKQKPLVQHVIESIQPQVKEIIISANRNHDYYASLGFPVYKDGYTDFAGPLAGILQALQHCQTEWLLTVPADSPFIPADLVSRLLQNIKSEKVVLAHDGAQLQPTFALIHTSLEPSLAQFLQQGERKTRVWMQQQAHLIVDFSDQPDAFININTKDDLENAEKHLN